MRLTSEGGDMHLRLKHTCPFTVSLSAEDDLLTASVKGVEQEGVPGTLTAY